MFFAGVSSLLVAGVVLVTLIRKPYTRGTMGEADIAVNALLSGADTTEQAIPDEPLPAGHFSFTFDPRETIDLYRLRQTASFGAGR